MNLGHCPLHAGGQSAFQGSLASVHVGTVPVSLVCLSPSPSSLLSLFMECPSDQRRSLWEVQTSRTRSDVTCRITGQGPCPAPAAAPPWALGSSLSLSQGPALADVPLPSSGFLPATTAISFQVDCALPAGEALAWSHSLPSAGGLCLHSLSVMPGANSAAHRCPQKAPPSAPRRACLRVRDPALSASSDLARPSPSTGWGAAGSVCQPSSWSLSSP